MSIQDHGLSPAAIDGPAAWILHAFQDGPGAQAAWGTVLRYGPPGFEVYARVTFFITPAEHLEERLERDRTALEVLAVHTRTPDLGYAAVWDGWCGKPSPVEAPAVPVPDRGMLLFTGPVVVLHDAPNIVWDGEPSPFASFGPAYAWPEDAAWLVACDVDEEVEFSVGCSAAAFDALTLAMPGAVRRVDYGAWAPGLEHQRPGYEQFRRELDAAVDQDPEPRAR